MYATSGSPLGSAREAWLVALGTGAVGVGLAPVALVGYTLTAVDLAEQRMLAAA